MWDFFWPDSWRGSWRGLWRNEAAFGIDIGSSAVKLLQLRRKGSGYCVAYCAVRPLPAGAVEEKRLVDPAAVGAVLRGAALASPAPARRAVVAVPGSAVIIRQLTLDTALSDAELEMQVFAEAERHIPFAPGEVALDFARLELPSSSPTPSPASANATPPNVLLAVCRKEYVDARVAALASGGYAATVVEIETQAMERAFALLGDTAGLVALADLGSDFLKLYVLQNGTVLHLREQAVVSARPDAMNSESPIMEQNLQKHTLSEHMLSEYTMPEYTLPEYTLQGDTSANSALPGFALHDQVAHLSRALQVFYSSSTYHRVDRLVLAGGGAVQPGLAALAERTLQIPVTVADPFAAMSYDGPSDTPVDAAWLAREGPVLLLAVGLALRGLRDD